MRSGAYVTVFTGDTGFKRTKIELSINYCARRVAAKAGFRFVRRELSSNRLFKSCWSDLRIAGRDFESPNRRVVTDQTFVVDAVAFKHRAYKSAFLLSSVAKTPADGETYDCIPVGYRIGALTIPCFHDIGVAKFLKCELGMGI